MRRGRSLGVQETVTMQLPGPRFGRSLFDSSVEAELGVV
jgi:hypothetical protein